MTIEEKLSIARGTVTPLLRKIRAGNHIYFAQIKEKQCFANIDKYLSRFFIFIVSDLFFLCSRN